MRSKYTYQTLGRTYRVTDFGGNYYNCSNKKTAERLVQLLNQEVEFINQKQKKVK